MKRVSGNKLRALMDKHGLQGEAGADVIAEMLHIKRYTVLSFYTKGIRRNDYELLELKLKSKAARP